MISKNTNRAELAYALGATFDYQQQVINCPDRYRAIRKCRQAGMTTAFAIEALIDALTYDNYVVCIISPTARQSARMMRYVKQAFRKLEKIQGHIIPTEKFTSEEIYFHHNSEIMSLPNNPIGVQGIDCNHAIIDEAGLFVANESEAIIDAVVGSLAAKRGRLTISGRPHGRRGMLWKYWNPIEDAYKEFTHFTVRWQDRAKFDPGYGLEVEKHKLILSKIQFDETYNAEFVDEGVLIFPHELLETSVALWDTRKWNVFPFDGQPSDDRGRFVGIDFGRKRDLTEIHILQKEEGDILRTFAMKSLDRVNFEVQKKIIDDMMIRFRPRCVKIDERGMGLPLLDYLVNKHGSVVQPLKMQSLDTKEKTVLQTQNAFKDLKLAIPDDDKLYDQLHSFQKEYTDSGNVRYTGKVDETDFMDDKVIALVAAVDAAKSSNFGFTIA